MSPSSHYRFNTSNWKLQHWIDSWTDTEIDKRLVFLPIFEPEMLCNKKYNSLTLHVEHFKSQKMQLIHKLKVLGIQNHHCHHETGTVTISHNKSHWKLLCINFICVHLWLIYATSHFVKLTHHTLSLSYTVICASHENNSTKHSRVLQKGMKQNLLSQGNYHIYF